LRTVHVGYFASGTHTVSNVPTNPLVDVLAVDLETGAALTDGCEQRTWPGPTDNHVKIAFIKPI
jgi:hypothetical protein